MVMLKTKFRSLWQNDLIQGVVLIASGTAGAQVIGLLFMPFITRVYGPETYGILSSFIALNVILTALASLGYPVAIVLPRRDFIARSVVKLSIVISASMSLLILLILVYKGEFILPKLGVGSLVDYIYFIPFVMFVVSCQDVAQQWLIRKQKFSSLSKVFASYSLINYGSQLLAGIYAPFVFVLISVYTLAITLRTVVTTYLGLMTFEINKSKDKEVRSLSSIAYEYRDFPLFRAPQIIINAISASLPLLMFTALFGPLSAGFYALTRTVLGIPLTLLGASVQSVFYPYFNKAFINKNKTLPLIFKATVALAILGLIPLLTLIFSGPYLFSFVFGQEWGKAGEYAQWLSLFFYFNLIARPAISIIPVLKIQKWFLGYEIVNSVFQLSGIWLASKFFMDELVAVKIYGTIGVVMFVLLILKVLHSSKHADLHLIKIK